MSRKDDRRKEVELIRAQAAEAAQAGKDMLRAMPHEYRGNMNERQWCEAFTRTVQQIEHEAERDEHERLIQQIQSMKSMDDLKGLLVTLLSKIEDLER